MWSVEQGIKRLKQGLKRAAIEAEFASVPPAKLAQVAEELPLSPELRAWYSQAAPQEEISFEWGAMTLFIHDLPGLVDRQEGWRWEVGRRDKLDPEWQPKWVVIANWDGDPAIADTAEPGTPVYKAPHGEGTWNPVPIAPNLGAFLAALGTWAEIVHGQFEGDVYDEDYEMRQEVRQALGAALEPILDEHHRRHWLAFE